jgi:hypothetical protein
MGAFRPGIVPNHAVIELVVVTAENVSTVSQIEVSHICISALMAAPRNRIDATPTYLRTHHPRNFPCSQTPTNPTLKIAKALFNPNRAFSFPTLPRQGIAAL